MLRTDKEQIVAELAAELGAAETLIVADYRGLTNKQLEALRDELIPHGARFRIVKNTLTRRAAEQAGADALLVMLEGPTAIAFIESSGDPAAVAKALAQTAKTTNVLTLRGGILEGKTLTGAEVDQLATLPPVDVLRGQLVGAIVAPLTQLLGLVSAPLRDLHGLIDARIKQLEEQGEVVEPVAEAAAAEPVAETEEPAGDEEPSGTEAEPVTDEGLAAEEPVAEADTPSDSTTAGSDASNVAETAEDPETQEEEE
ncbi:MAG TPA: 50S ribosomal protein L10 [Gaiellaceae bacterium]|nr:50S ribosomal protein L10 [Gaiellaceae bacterium]